MTKKGLFICIISIFTFTNAKSNVTDKWPDIPLLTVTTENGEFPTCDIVYPPEGCVGTGITANEYVAGRLVMTLGADTLYDSGDYVKDESGVRMKIRGNSTGASEGQKPYKLKLSKKFDMLFRGDEDYKEKDWNMLKISTWNPGFANSESNILNVLGFALSKYVGMEWTPGYTFVNLVMNDKYMGMYYLTDAIERGDKRVDIKKSGYLIENDAYWWNEDLYFKTGHQNSVMGWTYKYPDAEDVDDAITGNIQTYINDFEDALYSGADVDEYIDLASFAKWILVHDILSSDDAAGTNMYMYKHDYDESNPYSTKLMMGPLWDFDSSFKTDAYDSWSSMHSLDYFYYPQLFNNGKFVAEYKNQWESIKPALAETVANALDSVAQAYGGALEESMNLHKTVYPTECANSLQSQIDEINGKIEKRMACLDSMIENLQTSDISQTTEFTLPRSIVAVYDVCGRQCGTGIDNLSKGVYVVRYDDGSSQKILKK